MSKPIVLGSELLRSETVSILLVALMQEFARWYRVQATCQNDNLEITFIEFKSAGEPFVPDIVDIRIACSFVNERGFTRSMVLRSTCSLSRRKGEERLSFVFAPIQAEPTLF